MDVNFGISIRNPQTDIPWMSISEYPYEIHGPISRGCHLWISIRNPQNDIPWMSISEYPYEIHRTISHGCQFRNIHTKSTDRYPVDVPSGYPYEIHRTISHGQGQPCCPLAEKLLTITVIALIWCYPASMTIN